MAEATLRIICRGCTAAPASFLNSALLQDTRNVGTDYRTPDEAISELSSEFRASTQRYSFTVEMHTKTSAIMTVTSIGVPRCSTVMAHTSRKAETFTLKHCTDMSYCRNACNAVGIMHMYPQCDM